MINSHLELFKGKRVLITGHTGFKGAWLSLWLHSLGAEVFGYALAPPTEPNLYSLCNVEKLVQSNIGDIRDFESLRSFVLKTSPEIIFHLAAQPLVRESYLDPRATFETNVMGTVNVFECLRASPKTRVLINITTDKCYENKEWLWAYRESERLGGHDPYSCSKACSELLTTAYSKSFFTSSDGERNSDIGVASARAGNVIGGGDWGKDRLIPDCIRALVDGQEISLRYPKAVRPWQHVLDPLNGYLLLAARIFQEPSVYSGAWNFGPDPADSKTVEFMVKELCTAYGGKATYSVEKKLQPHEASYLKLDSTKAREIIGWQPCWTVEDTIQKIVTWVKAYQNKDDLLKLCHKQIEEFVEQHTILQCEKNE